MEIFIKNLVAQSLYMIVTSIMGFYDSVLIYMNDVGLDLAALLPIIENFERKAGDVCLDMAITLITIKFLKKGFETYISYTDGDADSDPIYLITLYCKAIGTACSFNIVYDYFITAIQKFIIALLKAIGLAAVPSSEILLNAVRLPNNSVDSKLELWATTLTSINILSILLLVVFTIMVIIMFFKMCKTGLENMILKVGFPLATIGLLDADKGVFKTYFMSLVKNILTVILQLIMMKMALGMFMYFLSWNVSENFFNGEMWLTFIISIALLVTAMSTPKLLAEFLIPSGGGLNMATLYYGKQMITGVKNIFKK